MADRYNNEITQQADALGGISGLTDTQGRQLTVTSTQDSDHLITQIQDPSGRLWKYAYDPISRALTSYTDPANNTTYYGYDSNNNMTKITSPAGNVTLISYDSSARVTGVVATTDAGHTTGPTRTYAYWPVNVSPTTTSSAYSACPDPTHSTATVVTDPDYDGNPMDGHWTEHCANAQDQVTATFTLNPWGSGFITHHASYNAQSQGGGPDWINGPQAGGTSGNSYTNYGYDSTGSDLTCIAQGSSSGNCSSGSLKSVFDYSDTNDPFQASHTTSPQQNNTNWCYYGGSSSCPGGATGPNGALATQKDDLSSQNQQNFSYNTNGTPSASTDADGNTTHYYYDTSGNLTSVVAPGGACSPSRKLCTSISPDANTSRPNSVTDGNGNTAAFTYDKLDRITNIAYSGSKGNFSVAYTYDTDGNLIKRADPQGTTTYTVDSLGRIIAESFPDGISHSYGYDKASNMTSFTDASGTANYAYNIVTELTSMTGPGDSTATTFTYDTAGNRTTTTYKTGVTLTRSYDALTGRLKGIVAKTSASGATITSSTYAYTTSTGCPGPGGSGTDTQLIQKTTDQASNVTNYCRDPLDRLESASTSGSSVNQNFAYTYDGDGNRLNQTINLSGSTGGTTTTYAYDPASQLCWSVGGSPSAGCGAPPPGATTYTSDSAGELSASSAGLGLAYNAGDQTTSMTPPGGSSTTARYFGTGQNGLMSLGLTTIDNSQLGTTAQTEPTGTTSYGRTPDGELIDIRAPDGSRYWTIPDQNNSVKALVNSSGTIQASYNYGPYGENAGTTGSVSQNPFRYDGGYQTPANLIHFGQRYYDPATGRWTQQDPLNQIQSLTQGDRYAFTGDNPVDHSDPGGLCFVVDCSVYHSAGHYISSGYEAVTRFTESKGGDVIGGCAGFGSQLIEGGPYAVAAGCVAGGVAGYVGADLGGAYDSATRSSP